MQLPKSLLPSTEKEILEEIAEELDIPLNKINETFSIWLDYLQDINDNTEQCTVNFAELGKMYINEPRLKHARGRKEREWAKKKWSRIEREIPESKKNHHKVTLPICVVYGTGRKNYKLGRTTFKDNYSFFTKEECIRRQNIVFFREDREFNDKKEIFEEYFNDIPAQVRHEKFKRLKDYKIQIKRQEQIKRCRMVRGKKIRMRQMQKK